MANITSSQTFAHFGLGMGLGFVVLKAGRPLGIYGCSSQLSFVLFRYQIPDPLAQWPGAHKYAIILHFPLLRSIFIFIFIFIYLQMAFAAALRSHAHFAMFMALATFGRRQQIDFYTKMRVHTYLFMRHIYLLIHIFILIYMHNLHLTYFYGAFADGQEKSKYFIRHGNV